MRDLEILERVLHVVGLDAALGHQFGVDRGFFQARAAWWSCAAESISPGARSVMAWNSRSASSLWLMRRNRKASSRELDIGGIEIESPAEFVNVRIAGGQQFAGSFSRAWFAAT